MADEGTKKHSILEFFSGIGGMHYAAENWSRASSSSRSVEIVAAFEVSDVCNLVYSSNFGENPIQRSIEHLDASYLDSFNADTWLMSPPCQPYTSMGKQKDDQDPRARALLHLCQVVQDMQRPPNFILLENVNNFQHSNSHDRWLQALGSIGFMVHEFLLSPTQFGIPNERIRYYALARRIGKSSWNPDDIGKLLRYIPGREDVVCAAEEVEEVAGEDKEEDKMSKHREGGHGLIYVDLNRTRASMFQHCKPIAAYLDESSQVDLTPYMVADNDLMKWKGYVFDIVTPESRRCSCFTKSYSKYIRGTGSLLSTNFYDEEGRCIFDVEDPWSIQDLNAMRGLKLRYFTETEVSRLMGFPEERFKFPQEMLYPKSRLGYRMLGNSLNVEVVASLLEYLFKED